MPYQSTADIGGYKTQSGWSFFEDYWVVKFCDTTSIATGHSSLPFAYGLSVYPNPFATEITIAFNQQNEGHISLTIYDLLGQSVFTIQENKTAGNFTKIIDLRLLSRGIYFLEVNMDACLPGRQGERRITKIVKE